MSRLRREIPHSNQLDTDDLTFKSVSSLQGVFDYISKLEDIPGVKILSHDIDKSNGDLKLTIYIANGDIIKAKYIPGNSASVILNDEPVYNESNPPIDYISSFLSIIPRIYKDYISSNGDLDVNESMQPDSTTYTV